MIEKHIVLDGIDLVVFYGVRNVNMQLLKSLFPKLHIVARGNVIKVLGEEDEIVCFEEVIRMAERHVLKYNTLTEEDVLDIVNGRQTREGSIEGVIVYGVSGRPITAVTVNQQRLVASFQTHDLIFVIGPAGSGKTYTAIALAVRAFKDKSAKRIILSRPAVEAGEKLGFLPGDMRDKIDPYLQPLYDALQDMLPHAKLQELLEKGFIQIAPLAFMRGRTLSDAVVILDEAQNTTSAQLKMFLTRMGNNTKMIVTGDVTQIDLPPKQRSGLVEAMEILNGVKGIDFIQTDKSDIVRHKLVGRIVEAYENYNFQNKNNMNTLMGTDFHFLNQKGVYHGKVRDVYNIGDDMLVMVATDRISAFDVILPRGIPYKGQVLNQIAAAALDDAADIVPNWKLAMPDPMVTVGMRCEPFRVEMIIRGYLTGSAWREYNKGVRMLCGVTLPDGMRENQRFVEPIITPTTKAEEGHDENISKEEIIARGLVSSADYEQMEQYTRALFERGSEIAARRGLILVDTKYEFGKRDGKVILIDEIHTPDSSRYFYADGYEERFAKGEPQRQLSKEFVRQWLIDKGFMGKPRQEIPEMTDEFVQSISQRYIELYEHLVGKPFVKSDISGDPLSRIESNVRNYLAQR